MAMAWGKDGNRCRPGSSGSFSSEQRIPLREAALCEALIRLRLFYPLASFDISGQQPVFIP